MSTTIYLGRQPIVDRQQKCVAYELLFRSGPENHARFHNDVHATATVILHTFLDLGLSRVLHGRPGFINVNESLLKSPVLTLLPPDNIILEILESVPLDERVRERCQELKARGYRLALDDVHAVTPEIRAMLPLLDYVKIDLQQLPLPKLHALLADLQGFNGQLLAEKVDSQEQFDLCYQAGMTLFQGYFFAKPTIMTQNRANPHRVLMLRLLGLIMQDADVGELELAFKGAPDMVLSLLKLVNAAEHYGRPIHSIRDALVMLGSAKLKRWALLFLFAANCQPGKDASPLLELAAVRGRMMELLTPDSQRDDAFMAGILSLADSLLGMPMSELIATLSLRPTVEAALLSRSGDLGLVLEQIEMAECRDEDDLRIPVIDAEQFNQAQLDALSWVREIWSDEVIA